jgi:hypothetical protein
VSRGRRLLRELGAVLVLLVALIVLIIGQRWHGARMEVAAAVAEADRLDPGWRFEDMVADRRLPPPERNSALQVFKVKSLLPRGWPNPPANGKDKPAAENDPPAPPEPTRLLTAREARQLREALTWAGPALGEAQKLADMPEGRYPITWATDIDSTPCPWTDALYSTNALLDFDAALHNQQGDSDGALRDARAVLNLGRSLGEEAFYCGVENRHGRRCDAVKVIERTLALNEPSEAALAATQEALRSEDAVSLSLAHFRGHRAETHRFLADVDDGKHRLSEWGCMRSQGVRAYAEVWLYRERAIRVHVRYLRAMNEAVEIAKLPVDEQAPRYRPWRKEYGQVENVGDALCFGGSEFPLLYGHAALRCAETAVAAERYRRKHGNWPPSLADLVPQYLSAVPRDPFDGKPLRYRKTDRGAIIYSLYDDGNGADRDRLPDAASSKDVVFTLWNVDQRRQPPLPGLARDAGGH